MGGLDVVLDDGSHHASDQRASFNFLFPLLSDGGAYVIADLHTAYWPKSEGGLRRPGTAIEFLKQKIDVMHQHYYRKGLNTSAAMPDIETATEQGYPALIARLFVGLFAPAKTPAAIVAKVAEVTREALQSAALKDRFAAAGFQVVADLDVAAARRYLDEESARWKPIVEQVGLQQE